MPYNRRGSLITDPEQTVRSYGIPWIHRDQWNDKDWYYSIEGNNGQLQTKHTLKK